MPVTWHSLFETVEGLVAFGTILLALGTLGVALLARSTARATRRLATETRELVDATAELARVSAEEVEMSRRALQAEVKPLFVDWPADNRKVTLARNADERLFTIPVVNAGAPGLIQRATMHWHEVGAVVSPATYEGTATVLAVSPGGGTDVQFLFPRSEFSRIDHVEERSRTQTPRAASRRSRVSMSTG